MLRALYALMKEITKLFWVGVASAVVLRLTFMQDMTTVMAVRVGLVAALVFVLLELAYYLIASICRHREDVRISVILEEQGVTPELLYRMERRVKRAKGPVRKAIEQLTLASFLSEGGYYDRCFETLREIDFGALTEDCREEYFNIYVYSNLMSGDLDSAQRIFDVAAPYFERAQLRAYPMPVLHTMGVLEYTKHNYVLAENLFSRALAASRGDFSKCECQIYLSLCYLKMGSIERAVYVAKSARETVTTIYQRRALEDVRAQIEQLAVKGNNSLCSNTL